MKKEISICFDFKGVGHGNISVFPADDCPPYLQNEAGCKSFNFAPGDYLLRIEGVVSIAGATVRVLNGGNELASLELPSGYFSRPLNFTV